MKKLAMFCLVAVISGVAYSESKAIVVRIGGSDGWSSIHIYKDVETGCQYIVAAQSGITPRIGADYMHMGCKGYEGLE